MAITQTVPLLMLVNELNRLKLLNRPNRSNR